MRLLSVAAISNPVWGQLYTDLAVVGGSAMTYSYTESEAFDNSAAAWWMVDLGDLYVVDSFAIASAVIGPFFGH